MLPMNSFKLCFLETICHLNPYYIGFYVHQPPYIHTHPTSLPVFNLKITLGMSCYFSFLPGMVYPWSLHLELD